TTQHLRVRDGGLPANVTETGHWSGLRYGSGTLIRIVLWQQSTHPDCATAAEYSSGLRYGSGNTHLVLISGRKMSARNQSRIFGMQFLF
ncbi:MAG: hypothetical protein IIY55_07865, partial [Blautia sp.]|nr:hypothetical protein [Blautia sp.]